MPKVIVQFDGYGNAFIEPEIFTSIAKKLAEGANA